MWSRHREVVVTIETTARYGVCAACGTRAEAQERMPIEVRDLACFGRPTRLVWRSGGGVAGSRL